MPIAGAEEDYYEKQETAEHEEEQIDDEIAAEEQKEVLQVSQHRQSIRNRKAIQYNSPSVNTLSNTK